MLPKIDEVAEWLRTAKTAIAFSGAGISTDSGIPDFRSPQGVWAKSKPVYYQDFLASAAARREAWRQKAEFYPDLVRAQPNPAHRILAEWQAAGRLQRVITQNIDGLHTLAGSAGVLELHGTAREVACVTCEARFPAEPYMEQFAASGLPPTCPQCGWWLKHATVSFGQNLPEPVLAEAWRLAESADLFFALGSSLVVQPAASLPQVAKQQGARLVIVNRDPTPLDDLADVVWHASVSEALSAI